MTNENDAALDDAINAALEPEVTEQETVEVEETKLEESAPSDDSQENDDNENGVQKRINKITADKYAEKRRADELQRKLDELQSKPKTESKTPDLKDFDYDDDAYSAALIDHKVQKAIEAKEAQRITELESQKADQVQKSFHDRAAKLGKDDFADVANNIPLLPQGVVEALMSDEHGAKLVYHLGTHLDQADRIANMSPAQALLEVGRMSAKLDSKPQIKTSAAPEPIDTITSGGSLKKDISEMSMEEIYNLR